jgi:hypothetical protein
MRESRRLIFGALIAAVGIGAAVYMYQRSSARRPQAPPVVLPNAVDAQRERLSKGLTLDVTPSLETVDQVVRDAAAIAASGAASIQGTALPAPEDLTGLFAAQLRETLNGDFDRRLAMLVARGIKVTDTPEDRRSWEAGIRISRLARIGLDQLRVEPVYVEGRRVKPDELKIGWDRSEMSFNQDVMPISKDIEGQRLTIVEVSLPMELTRARTEERRVGITAYRYAWNREKRQWVPWSIVVLKTDDGIVLFPRF